jgi:hypothetical protein
MKFINLIIEFAARCVAVAMLFAILFVASSAAFAQSKQETEKWLSDFSFTHSRWVNDDGSMGMVLFTLDNCAAEERYQSIKDGNISIPRDDKDLWWKFSFGDIDPEHIKVHVPLDHHSVATYVELETTDSKPVIYINGGSTGVAAVTINIDSVENAKRFSNALKHEVLLCGGKASTF